MPCLLRRPRVGHRQIRLACPSGRATRFPAFSGVGPADAILVDGTFWSSDDFEKSGVCTRSMAELLQSHLPIWNISLERLAATPANHKIYIHINNTNPIRWDSGPERRLLQELGIGVVTDGMTIEV